MQKKTSKGIFYIFVVVAVVVMVVGCTVSNAHDRNRGFAKRRYVASYLRTEQGKPKESRHEWLNP